MLIDTNIIIKYGEYLEMVCKLFEEGKLERKKFYDAINMERHTFARKVKQRSFTTGELLSLSTEINKSFNV
jgi:hypothetical protein